MGQLQSKVLMTVSTWAYVNTMTERRMITMTICRSNIRRISSREGSGEANTGGGEGEAEA
eukprot:3946904-Heterocapsa_arctica.AAC.1